MVVRRRGRESVTVADAASSSILRWESRKTGLNVDSSVLPVEIMGRDRTGVQANAGPGGDQVESAIFFFCGRDGVLDTAGREKSIPCLYVGVLVLDGLEL